jgi:FkbM family methyltransferase
MPDDSEIRGYFEEDLTRVARLIAHDIEPDRDVYIDAFGVKVDPAYCAWAKPGTIGSGLPFPGDGIGADGIEFAALALALEFAQGQPDFTSVELGAGWGTWTALAALCAHRIGFQSVNLIAFEADRGRFQDLRRHLVLNGIANAKLHQCAAWWRNEKLFWPVRDRSDAGMSVAVGERPSADYRGKVSQFEKITGRSIAEVLSIYPRIDFMHVDIQGAEWDVIAGSIDFLNSRVRSLFVATHSRKIEGDLIALLRSQGWLLMRETPCHFYSMASAPTLEGLTYHDGGQFWRNDRDAAGR